MVQSPMFDGKMSHWYHPKCFFGRARPKGVTDIAHFDSLRWEDQVTEIYQMDMKVTGHLVDNRASLKRRLDYSYFVFVFFGCLILLLN
jgi:hypothetical protein